MWRWATGAMIAVAARRWVANQGRTRRRSYAREPFETGLGPATNWRNTSTMRIRTKSVGFSRSRSSTDTRAAARCQRLLLKPETRGSPQRPGRVRSPPADAETLAPGAGRSGRRPEANRVAPPSRWPRRRPSRRRAGTTELSTSPIAPASIAAAMQMPIRVENAPGGHARKPDLDDAGRPGAMSAGYKTAKAMIEDKRSFEPLVAPVCRSGRRRRWLW